MNLATILWSDSSPGRYTPGYAPEAVCTFWRIYVGSMYINAEKNGVASPHARNSKIPVFPNSPLYRTSVFTHIPSHYFTFSATEPHGTLQSLMAHYKRPPHFHLHTSLILLFHCPTYSSPSSYSNNSILLLCIYFVILSTTLSSCDQYERKHPGVKYRCRGALHVCSFTSLKQGRFIQIYI